jgi:Protein of unknown function (DUF3135)
MKFTPQKFDELLELAQRDPQALEQYRQQQIDAVIDGAPAYLRTRLEGLQFQIDAQRTLHTSPMGACVKLTQMMQDSFSQLQDMLSSATDENMTGNEQLPQKNAKILPFTANS